MAIKATVVMIVILRTPEMISECGDQPKVSRGRIGDQLKAG